MEDRASRAYALACQSLTMNGNLFLSPSPPLGELISIHKFGTAKMSRKRCFSSRGVFSVKAFVHPRCSLADASAQKARRNPCLARSGSTLRRGEKRLFGPNKNHANDVYGD